MIDRLQPYSEYKESGKQWLGQIPRHWDVRRTKLILREVDSRTKTGKEQLLRVSQYTGVTERKAIDGSDAPDTRASSLVGYKRVAPQDLVINIMLAWNGSMGVSRFSGIASPAYCVYRFRGEVFPWYFHNLFRTPLYKGQIKAASTGVVESRLRLYSDDLGRIEALLPPPDEQAAIVRFLDYANRKIDGFIRAKQKLIGLLNEQKQAIIHHAVTRGLDPSVPLKPSGIPWLGDIPKHWEVRKLGSIFLRHGSGTTPSGDKYYGGDIPWVMSGDLKDCNIITTKRTVTKLALKKFRALKLHAKGSLLVAMYGATIGKTGVLSIEACSNQACCALASPCSNVNPVFIQSIVIMARNHFMQQAYGGGQPNINAEIVRTLRVPLPPMVEQNSILLYLDSATIPLTTAITRAEQEIALMQEYRTRLKADVVTGKLDVRPIASHLPESPINESETVLDEETAEDLLEA